MDLLQYLIAPHEQQQQWNRQDQQSTPDVTSTPTASRHVQQPRPITPILTRDLYQQLQQQDLTQSAGYAQAPISMPLHQRYAAPSYTHSPVSSPIYAGPSNGNEIFQTTMAQQQQEQSSSMVLSREQLIQGLSAHPDVLASLLRNGGLAGLTTTLQNAGGVRQAHSESQAPSREQSTGSSSTATTPRTPQIASATKKPTLCFWWYHYGECNKDPQSPSFNGSPNPCQMLHYLHNVGMEEVKLHHFPNYWHKMGDCGLDRCRLSSTYRHLSRPIQKQKQSQEQGRLQSQHQDQQQVQQKVQQQSPHHRYSLASNQGDGQPELRTFTAIDAPSTPTPTTLTIPTSAAAGRHGPKQYQHQHQKHSPKSPIPRPTLKRKASALSPPPAPSTLSIRTAPVIPKLKLHKHDRRKLRLAAAAYKPLEIIPYTIYPLEFRVPKLDSKKTQTCFYWYHGTCPKSGKNCEWLHDLGKEIVMVQPPTGFVHGEVCTRDWCPGDWMWEHEGEPGERWAGKKKMQKQKQKERRKQKKWQDEENEDEDGDEYEHEEDGENDVVMGEGDTDVELSHEGGEVDEVDGEWYMEGFADA